ncbi:hypothetical protein niasHT_002628 [Heterodera trifolii]|uniref:HTH OST-type domain-containing protein n=1 Tax=Heterodera trifolii TaxID=157864 RepID=A0ABD2LU65_9BILA
MNVEESPLLREFKTFLQATLVAFGSDGALFSLVNQKFSEDWVGSPSLKEYATKLGFAGTKGILKLLQSIPDQVSILVNPTGEVILKPVPMEETRDNLAKIDATNRELKAEKMRRQQFHGPLPAAVTAQLAAAMMPGWPPQVPVHPLASVFNASIKRSAATPSAAGLFPAPAKKKINPNLIPLGPTRIAQCDSANNIADNGSANKVTNDANGSANKITNYANGHASKVTNDANGSASKVTSGANGNASKVTSGANGNASKVTSGANGNASKVTSGANGHASIVTNDANGSANKITNYANGNASKVTSGANGNASKVTSGANGHASIVTNDANGSASKVTNDANGSATKITNYANGNASKVTSGANGNASKVTSGANQSPSKVTSCANKIANGSPSKVTSGANKITNGANANPSKVTSGANGSAKIARNASAIGTNGSTAVTRTTSATEQRQQNIKIRKVSFEKAMRYMEREAWKRAEKRSDAYYEEDFRTPASPRNATPEPRPPANEPGKVPQAEPTDERGEKPAPKNANDQLVCEEKSESDEEDKEKEEEGHSDNGWEFVARLLNCDEGAEEGADKECATFLHRFAQMYERPVPEGIYRLVYIFRQNGGSFNRIDLLERKYLDTYGTRLSTSERNRLLGAPTATRIAKDSFSKASYQGLFRISERVSNCYGVALLPCLTGRCVDSSMFLTAHSLSATSPCRPSTSATTKAVSPAPQTQAQKPNQQPNLPSNNNAHCQFGGQKIDSVLSSYAVLLDSLKEAPLSPPFSVNQLVLFRLAKLGLCHGKIVRQDNQHLVVKHLDSQKEYFVNIDAVYAFPSQLLKEHSAKPRSCSKMACHPGTQFNFLIPVNGQQFRCF